MSVALRPSSKDGVIEAAFGHSMEELHQQQATASVSPAVQRMLELRRFLTVAEDHLDEVRDRLHTATAPGQEPAAEDLAVDLQWLAAATTAKAQYAQAIDELLRTMPTSSSRPAAARPVATALPVPRAAPASTTPAVRRNR
ncbi:hypothetical protein [Streptomyces roseifaciens]|uniref:hypothetical protein n=1 Tax=Streptomyces roseifaciens TaxID=1488406 RepID=UPI000717F24D|nr:hypothetical protein [Streptomyces roseifaciens]